NFHTRPDQSQIRHAPRRGSLQVRRRGNRSPPCSPSARGRAGRQVKRRERATMWKCIRLVAIAAAFLAGATATAYAQDSMTQYPGKAAPGKSKSDKAGPNSSGTASGGNGALGAGDAGKGDWTATNPGVTRGPAGAYSGYGLGYTTNRVLPRGHGTLRAGDANVGGWAGTNPGIDGRAR